MKLKFLAVACLLACIVNVEYVRYREGKEWSKYSQALQDASLDYWGRTPSPPYPKDWDTSCLTMLLPSSMAAHIIGVSNCHVQINGMGDARRVSIWPPLKHNPPTNSIWFLIRATPKNWEDWYLRPEDLEIKEGQRVTVAQQ